MKIVFIIGERKEMRAFKFKGYMTMYQRLNNSTNGNPCYWLSFENDKESLSGRTKSDAQCAYSCLNYPLRERIITYHFTRKGNLIIDTIKIAGIDY